MRFILFFIFYFCLVSCKNTDNGVRISQETFIKSFSIDHFENGRKLWTLKCDNAVVDDKKNTIKCFETTVKLFRDKLLTTDMKSRFGFGDLSENSFYLKNNVYILSYAEDTSIESDVVYFDFKKNIIHSDLRSRIVKKRDNVEIISNGFKSNTDISNIKFFNHTTRVLK